MYAHPAFKVHRAVGLAFAAARGFGQVIACERPVASLLPFHVSEADGRLPRVHFHVARPNPLARLAAKGGPWLIAVAGDDTYVSPHWYANLEQVPTWLYEAVQLGGPVHVVPPDYVADHLERLAAQFESGLMPKPPWRVDGLSPQRRATLMESIVAIEMTVETVEGSFKLNQHKTDTDQVAVVRALRAQDKPSTHSIAARMVALRPHLAYE